MTVSTTTTTRDADLLVCTTIMRAADERNRIRISLSRLDEHIKPDRTFVFEGVENDSDQDTRLWVLEHLANGGIIL